jgi:HAD superfamily hydrolase (TIGR01509 family)
MLKLIIFDLDGVLVDSKDIHYEALNKALVDFGETPIPYEEHISIYDGKPTKEKLRIKGVDKTKHVLINDRKQSYTTDLLESKLAVNGRLVDLFKRLKEEGFIIAVSSNSIRYTIQLVLFKIGVMRYVDHIVSNQDVELGKPHPEMYLKSMLHSKVGPRDTLIIEDSYVGRQAAFNSGAYLCAVRNPEEVSYGLIKRSIDKSNNIRPKWKGNNMNVLIPMAGAGSRFVNAGYTFPKPLIEVNGKPMIQVVVEDLNIEGQYIYIVRKEHYEKYSMKYMLEMITPGCKIIQIDHLTEGAACTTLLAKEYINNDEQLLIANSDQYVEWDSSDFMYSVQGEGIDGGILVFYNTHPKWSYAKVNKDGFVTEVREKVVVSDKATVGIYHWKKGRDYVRYAEQMIRENIRVNGEFYVCPVYNKAIEDGKRFKTYSIDRDKMWGLGTPEDLNYFIESRK